MFLQKTKNGRNDLHLYIFTIIAVVFGYIIGQIPFTIALFKVGQDNGMETSEILEYASDNDLAAIGMNLNLQLALLLLTFASAFFVLWLCIRKLHRKSIVDVSTGRLKWDWNRIKFGFAVWFGLLLLGEIVGYVMDPDNYEWQFELQHFIPLVLITVILLPIQTTFEEVFTRGYLLQGFSMIFKNRWVPLLLTALFFGALHMANPEVSEYGTSIMFFNYAGTGFLLAAIALMDDGLEIPIGMHAANNIFGSLFVTFDDSALLTNAIFSLKEINIESTTIATVVFSVAFFFICKWKYNWSDWSKLYAKVDFSDAPYIQE
ncbi:MAG: CPBP family intramembrane metalloprotease [Bacteroidia bacterium]|nr:CPBP family intramembrane metalloprotease [Bacteroidia bacterium]